MGIGKQGAGGSGDNMEKLSFERKILQLADLLGRERLGEWKGGREREEDGGRTRSMVNARPLPIAFSMAHVVATQSKTLTAPQTSRTSTRIGLFAPSPYIKV